MAGGPSLRALDDVLGHVSAAMTSEQALILGTGA